MSEKEAIEGVKFKIQEEMKMSKKLQAIQVSTGGEKSALLQSLEHLKLSCRMF
jgi:hypothetical protein